MAHTQLIFSASAAVLAYEGFDQSAANFNNYAGSSSFGFSGSNWGSGSGVHNNSSVTVVGLSYPGIATIGGALNSPSNAGWARIDRALNATAQAQFNIGSVGFISLLFNAANGNRWDFGQNDSNVGFGIDNGRLGLNSGVDFYAFHNSGITPSLNTTHLLVCKISRLAASTEVSLYLNPTASTLESAPSYTYTYGSSIGFQMSSYKNDPNVQFDEIRVASTFADVKPVPEPGALVLTSAAAFGLLVNRRRRCA